MSTSEIEPFTAAAPTKGSPWHHVHAFVRLLAQLIGLAVILLGVWLSVQVFQVVWKFQEEDSVLQRQLAIVAQFFGENMRYKEGETHIEISRPLAAFFLVGLYGTLAQIGLAIMWTGGKLVFMKY